MSHHSLKGQLWARTLCSYVHERSSVLDRNLLGTTQLPEPVEHHSKILENLTEQSSCF